MKPGAAVDVERRTALNATKLKALVHERWGADVRPVPLGTGAAASGDGRAYVLLDGGHGLGAALAWADRAGAAELHVVDDERAGTTARLAGYFTLRPTTWRTAGRALEPADAEPFPPTAAPPDAPELVGLLGANGLEVVVEGDRIAGEVLGLEVARVVHVEGEEPGIEVGVGRFDRELTAMLHGDLTPEEALARVTARVRELRGPEAPRHPLRDLVPERWLRAVITADPSLVGCAELVAAPTPVPRDRLRTRGAAAASGTTVQGAPVVAVCVVGPQLEAIPEAADTRAYLDPDAELVLVMPARDRLPVTDRLAAALDRPARVLTVPDTWRG